MSDEIRICGIDPGEYIGVAVARSTGDAGSGWEVEWAKEMLPDEFCPWFMGALSGLDWVTCESFFLRKDVAMSLIGSDFPTVKIIGFVQHTIEVWNKHSSPGITYESNKPDIQDGTASTLRAAGIKPVSGADHHHNARSAELHLYYTLIKAGQVTKADGKPLVIR